MTYSTIIDKMWTDISETVPYVPLRDSVLRSVDRIMIFSRFLFSTFVKESIMTSDILRASPFLK